MGQGVSGLALSPPVTHIRVVRAHFLIVPRIFVASEMLSPIQAAICQRLVNVPVPRRIFSLENMQDFPFSR
jgi:hypothetical protein